MLKILPIFSRGKGKEKMWVKEELDAAIPINTKMYSHGCLTASTYTQDSRLAALNDKFSAADQECLITV